MKLSRGKILKIFEALELLVNNGVKKTLSFKYVSKKIRELLKNEVEAIKEVQPKLKLEYENNKNQILIEFAEKDDNGKPKTLNGSNYVKDLVIPQENFEKIAGAINILNTNTNFEEIMNEEISYNKFMDGEIEIDLPMINKKDLWDDISDKIVDDLFDIIEE